MVQHQSKINSGEIVVLFEDECHLLWGDVCGFAWGKRHQAIEVPILNQKLRQTYTNSDTQPPIIMPHQVSCPLPHKSSASWQYYGQSRDAVASDEVPVQWLVVSDRASDKSAPQSRAAVLEKDVQPD